MSAACLSEQTHMLECPDAKTTLRLHIPPGLQRRPDIPRLSKVAERSSKTQASCRLFGADESEPAGIHRLL